jgi:hypothetical protein
VRFRYKIIALPSNTANQIFYDKYDNFDNILPKIEQETTGNKQEIEYQNGNVNVFIPG